MSQQVPDITFLDVLSGSPLITKSEIYAVSINNLLVLKRKACEQKENAEDEEYK